jgi:soluble lytic murein transglycosylase
LAAALILVPASAHGQETPWFDAVDGLAAASQALSTGNPAGARLDAARALAARPAAPARARLALGLALAGEGQPTAAARELTAAASQLPAALAAHARAAAAEALLAAGDARSAAALLADAVRDAPMPLARRVRAREVDALLAAGDARRAADRAETILAGDPALPAVRLALARAWQAEGDDARAIAAYRALWSELPADPAGIEAGRALAAGTRAGGPVPPATADEQLARAERLVQLAHPRQALIALSRLDPAAPPAALARAHLLRALADLQLGRVSEGEAAALCADVDGATPEVRTGARLVLARAAARLGRTDEAIARYGALGRERPRAAIPGLSPAAARSLPDDAAYLSAWLLFDAGRHAPAARALGRYAQQRPASHRATDARWFEAWSLRRAGRVEDARRAFDRLARGALAPAALYWRARMETPGTARALYRRAIAAEPGGWYALLSASRLSALGEEVPALLPAASAPIPDGVPDGPAAPAIGRAVQLLAAGLREEALEELRAATLAPGTRAAAPALAQLAAAAGDAELPFRIAQTQLAVTGRALRWSFPDAYADLAPRLAAEAGVDRWLLLAVMRRESSFRPDARSFAGAEGLVQLLPQTADRLVAVLGVDHARARGLEDPTASLPLGAAYLGLLQDRFQDPAAVLAAYNAGPPPVAAWARARAGLPLDEAVEELPFRETRRYVKVVLAARATYGWLWAGERLAIDGARPLGAPRAGVEF